MKAAIWILWPSFLVGALANALFFTAVDPVDLHAFWEAAPASRVASYTIGFFTFWAIGACSSAFTCFIQRTANEVNRSMCPLPPDRRPSGCQTRVRTSL